jgi:hypothetical protein
MSRGPSLFQSLLDESSSDDDDELILLLLKLCSSAEIVQSHSQSAPKYRDVNAGRTQINGRIGCFTGKRPYREGIQQLATVNWQEQLRFKGEC